MSALRRIDPATLNPGGRPPSRPPTVDLNSPHGTQPGTRLPSPTPTLLPAFIPTEFVFNEQTYATIDEVIQASGAHHGINEKYTDWITAVIKDVVQMEVAQAYNVLGNKMYEHRNTANQGIEGLRTEFQDAKAQLQTHANAAVTRANERREQAEGHNKALQAEITVLKEDNKVLNDNNFLLVETIKTLQERITLLEKGHTPHAAPTTPATTRPRIADPPKYKGKGDITLEQWLQKFGIWTRYQNIDNDEQRITTALMFLEGGALAFMDDYAQQASEGQPLGSWSSFVDRLKAGYRELAPEKSAQVALDTTMRKRFGSVATFAEEFRRYASRTGYSDVELISRIDQHVPENIRLVQVTMRTTSPHLVPKTWENYLDWVLSLEMQLRDTKHLANTHTTPRQKDPNAMDIDALKKPEKLSKEQVEWLEKKLCFRCGKHPFRKNDKCRNPKYKGFYELPPLDKAVTATTSRARAVEEDPDSRMQFIRQALEEWDKARSTPSTPPAEDAHIDVVSEEGFLEGM